MSPSEEALTAVLGGCWEALDDGAGESPRWTVVNTDTWDVLGTGETRDEAVDQAAEDVDSWDDICPLCRGTGIGQSGPVDASRCSACRGSGVSRQQLN